MKRIAVFALALLIPIAVPHAEEGLASWYGIAFQGRKTSNGEIFDRLGFSAAHRSLPFGSLVLVTNLETLKRCVVRINDRGPFVLDRIIDLSEAAAGSIGMRELGKARVSLELVGESMRPGPLEPLASGPETEYELTTSLAATEERPPPGPSRTAEASSPPPPPGPALYGIQVASYAESGYADRCLERLRLSGFSPSLEKAGVYTRVILKDLPEKSLEKTKARLASLGYPNLLVRKAIKTN